MSSSAEITFLQWALPRLGYRWEGYRKPRGQVLKRIRERMQELQLTGGYAEYREFLIEHPEEWKVLDRLCDVTISKFFRDRKLWDFLREQVMPTFTEGIDEVLSVWSAGCCNGEEAYSFAIIFNQLKKASGIQGKARILASDRNSDVLERARKGIYPAGALKELTGEEVNTWFRRMDADQYMIRKQLAETVIFENRDIRQSHPEGKFHLVFCRNLVFTYFDKTEQLRFMQRLKPHLYPQGYLIIGANEELPENNRLQRISNTHPVYCS